MDCAVWIPDSKPAIVSRRRFLRGISTRTFRQSCLVHARDSSIHAFPWLTGVISLPGGYTIWIYPPLNSRVKSAFTSKPAAHMKLYRMWQRIRAADRPANTGISIKYGLKPVNEKVKKDIYSCLTPYAAGSKQQLIRIPGNITQALTFAARVN